MINLPMWCQHALATLGMLATIGVVSFFIAVSVP